MTPTQVFRIGQQPPRDNLFAGDLTDETTGWTGVTRTHDVILTLHKHITTLVDEIGGKVRGLSQDHVLQA